MWADTLIIAERAHLLRLAVWGGASVLVGSVLLCILTIRRARSALLTQFALQMAAWGLVIFGSAWLGAHALGLRDATGAARLEQFIWFCTGLAIGAAAVGATLALTGWRLGRRHGLMGAGIGVLVQGLALAVLEMHLTSVIARLSVM